MRKESKGDNPSSEVELKAAMTGLSSLDFASKAMEMLQRIRYIADDSSNLKETFVRDLYLCSKIAKVLFKEVHAQIYAPMDVVQLRVDNSRVKAQLAGQSGKLPN